MIPIRSRSTLIWSLVVAAASAIAIYVTHSRTPQAAATAVASVAPQPAAAADAPIPADSDARLRDALAGLTPRELFQTWLKADHLLDRLVVTTVNLAEDESPRAQLPFLQPEHRFKAAHGVIAPSSYARYDAFANVVSSLDEHRVAAAYRVLHPLLESAYHALGYPGRPFDAMATRALQRIVNAPVRDEVAVKRVGSVWVFADEHLESLGPVEKQLLRMGPRNTRLLQEEARAIAGALGLPLQAEVRADTP